MNNHITNAEWAEYQSGKGLGMDRLQLIARVHAHIGSCEKCRKLHEDFVQFRNRLDAFSSASRVVALPSAYRAVASDGMGEPADELGTLSIDFENLPGGGRFRYDSLEVGGDCEKYAFAPEEDGPKLADACDEGTWMEIADGMLRLSFPENDEVEVTAVLYDADNNGYELIFDENGCAEFRLSKASYTLEITLSALDA